MHDLNILLQIPKIHNTVVLHDTQSGGKLADTQMSGFSRWRVKGGRWESRLKNWCWQYA